MEMGMDAAQLSPRRVDMQKTARAGIVPGKVFFRCGTAALQIACNPVTFTWVVIAAEIVAVLH